MNPENCQKIRELIAKISNQIGLLATVGGDPQLDGDGSRAMRESILEINDLHVSIADKPELQIVRGANLNIRAGEVHALMGPNGSGKTTLLRILAGLNDSYSGDLLWRGRPRHTYREEFLRNMLYLGHRPGIKPLLTPMENLRALMAGRRYVTDKVLWQALEGTGLGGFQNVPSRNPVSYTHLTLPTSDLV